MSIWFWWAQFKEYVREIRDERVRRIDLQILWPAIKREAARALEADPALSEVQLLELARYAFITHMSNDPHWRRMADEWSEEQLGDFVRAQLT